MVQYCDGMYCRIRRRGAHNCRRKSCCSAVDDDRYRKYIGMVTSAAWHIMLSGQRKRRVVIDKNQILDLSMVSKENMKRLPITQNMFCSRIIKI